MLTSLHSTTVQKPLVVLKRELCILYILGRPAIFDVSYCLSPLSGCRRTLLATPSIRNVDIHAGRSIYTSLRMGTLVFFWYLVWFPPKWAFLEFRRCRVYLQAF